jgi:dihydrolipoamide dehydrogenase
MMHDRYDLVVIGAGGGGYPAALRIARTGQSVLMVDEKGNLGGNCLYEGCVPSKAVRHATQTWRELNRAAIFGLQAEPLAARWDQIRGYKDGVQSRRYAQHMEEIQSTEHLTMVRGRARFLDANRLVVEDWDRSETVTVKAKTILIATGSQAIPLTFEGAEHTWDHHDLFQWQTSQTVLPKELIVLGGGYIGVEVASMLWDIGVRVTVIEMESTILGHMDPDLRAAVSDHLRPRIHLVTGVKIEKLEVKDQGVLLTGHRLDDGHALVWTADQVLAAVGRGPAIAEDLGLDAAGVAYDDARGIGVDGQMHTSVPHIYAAGDVTGLSMLFHAAVRMSEIAADAILLGDEAKEVFHPEEMATIVFSRPEAFSVGLTRDQANERGIQVHEYVREMGGEVWAQIAEELDGFVKLVVHRQTGVILGMHGVGVDAAQLSNVAHMVVRLGLKPAELAHMTFAHPTQFEVLDRLARSV